MLRIYVPNLVNPKIILSNDNISSWNKGDGKRRNTLGRLDKYACNVLKQSGLWNSVGI